MKFLSLALIAITMICAPACKKYEDDNTVMSFRKPTTRLTQKWKVNYVVSEGEEVSDQFDSYYYNFENDGRVILQYTEYLNGEYIHQVRYGNWRLTNSDRRLEVNLDSLYTDYKILSLTSERMLLQSVNISERYTMYLVRAK